MQEANEKFQRFHFSLWTRFSPFSYPFTLVGVIYIIPQKIPFKLNVRRSLMIHRSNFFKKLAFPSAVKG